MATRRWSVGPSEPVESVVEAVGAATVTKPIELTVDLGLVKSGGTQQITKNEVLLALERLADFIQRDQWPPA